MVRHVKRLAFVRNFIPHFIKSIALNAGKMNACKVLAGKLEDMET
jgi:hypothetical protein